MFPPHDNNLITSNDSQIKADEVVDVDTGSFYTLPPGYYLIIRLRDNS
jgi:hypothetical protein